MTCFSQPAANASAALSQYSRSQHKYSWRQKSANKTDTGSAQSLVHAVNAMSLAVRPDSVSRQACALAGVTAAVEKACAASCKALTEAAT